MGSIPTLKNVNVILIPNQIKIAYKSKILFVILILTMKQHGKYCNVKWKNFNCGYTEYNYDKCVWTKTRKIKTMKVTIWWGGVIEGPLFKNFFLVNLCCPVKTRSRAYEISPVCWVFWKSMLFSKVTKCKVKEGLARLYSWCFSKWSSLAMYFY